MAREIENYRSVTNVVPDQSTAITLGSAGAMGAKVIAASQEAKIAENFSTAQLEISKLHMQYKTQWEHNPFGGMEDLKLKEQEIYDTLGQEISPFFQRPWQDSTRDFAKKTKGEMDMWAYKQSRVNTVKSINTSIKNNMTQAMIDGQTYGNSEESQLGSFMNYAASKEKLAVFGDRNVGKGETTSLLENYDGDYMKSFISGVSDSNPVKALRMMQDPKVKGAFKDQSQYVKMLDAVEKRALNVGEIMAQKQILGALRDENSTLANSLNTPLSYAQLQSEFSSKKMSPAAQAFFLKINGFSAREGGKLSQSEQLQNKADLYHDLTDLSSRENVGAADLAAFQERIYKGMDNGTLNEQEGVTYLNQIMAPYIDKQETMMKNFGEKKWFTDSLGFQGIQEMFENEVAVPVPEPRDKRKTNEGERLSMSTAEMVNNENKVKLYDYYFDALAQSAEGYGVRVGDIPNLNKAQKQKIYSEAQAQAKRNFMVDSNPALATLPDIPNQVFNNGTLIQGAAGARGVKADLSAPAQFKVFKGSDGVLYRQYSDGKYEAAGRWK